MISGDQILGARDLSRLDKLVVFCIISDHSQQPADLDKGCHLPDCQQSFFHLFSSQPEFSREHSPEFRQDGFGKTELDKPSLGGEQAPIRGSPPQHG